MEALRKLTVEQSEESLDLPDVFLTDNFQSANTIRPIMSLIISHS